MELKLIQVLETGTAAGADPEVEEEGGIHTEWGLVRRA